MLPRLPVLVKQKEVLANYTHTLKFKHYNQFYQFIFVIYYY